MAAKPAACSAAESGVDAHAITTSISLHEMRPRVLKRDDTFAVLDRNGEGDAARIAKAVRWAVRHDADNNGKTNWNDGGGFSNNPKLSLLKLKPSHRAASVTVGRGIRTVPVVLNYRSGLSIAPIGR